MFTQTQIKKIKKARVKVFNFVFVTFQELHEAEKRKKSVHEHDNGVHSDDDEAAGEVSLVLDPSMMSKQTKELLAKAEKDQEPMGYKARRPSHLRKDSITSPRRGSNSPTSVSFNFDASPPSSPKDGDDFGR